MRFLLGLLLGAAVTFLIAGLLDLAPRATAGEDIGERVEIAERALAEQPQEAPVSMPETGGDAEPRALVDAGPDIALR